MIPLLRGKIPFPLCRTSRIHPHAGAFKACLIAVRNMFIQTETTPNENALKFIPGVVVLDPSTVSQKSLEFTTASEAKRSPLAKALFSLEGVSTVFFGKDFISVNKEDSTEWKHLKPLIYGCIMDYFTASTEPIIYPNAVSEHEEIDSLLPKEGDSETVLMIKELLDTRIRPVIQGDGGDIEYLGFKDGFVNLKLQGACRSCASSAATLKQGIENMMMHYIPEVKGVRQVADTAEAKADVVFKETLEKLHIKE